jgi:hypothetical protein
VPSSAELPVEAAPVAFEQAAAANSQISGRNVMHRSIRYNGYSVKTDDATI